MEYRALMAQVAPALAVGTEDAALCKSFQPEPDLQNDLHEGCALDSNSCPVPKGTWRSLSEPSASRDLGLFHAWPDVPRERTEHSARRLPPALLGVSV